MIRWIKDYIAYRAYLKRLKAMRNMTTLIIRV